MTNINDIASVHLGKAGDGTVVKPYVTPDNIDPSLLVGIPRVLNRKQYKIDSNNLPFEGLDSWNCYEFSTLMNNGFPISGVLRVIYPANSPNIVESKSLKLYLNSYNMNRSGVGYYDCIDFVEKKVQEDLENVIGSPVSVGFLKPGCATIDPFNNVFFKSVEDSVDINNMTFDSYEEDEYILKLWGEGNIHTKFLHSYSLRSNCRVTNQPDWGDVFMYYKGARSLTEESFLKYIVSMRKENHFHEEICELIYKRLYDILNPEELFVACLYTRRGGIDINPVRASNSKLLLTIAYHLNNPYVLNAKTMRQ